MKSLMFALPLIAGLAVPAMAEDMHRYITVFKYSDTAMKAMTEYRVDVCGVDCVTLSRKANRKRKLCNRKN